MKPIDSCNISSSSEIFSKRTGPENKANKHLGPKTLVAGLLVAAGAFLGGCAANPSQDINAQTLIPAQVLSIPEQLNIDDYKVAPFDMDKSCGSTNGYMMDWRNDSIYKYPIKCGGFSIYTDVLGSTESDTTLGYSSYSLGVKSFEAGEKPHFEGYFIKIKVSPILKDKVSVESYILKEGAYNAAVADYLLNEVGWLPTEFIEVDNPEQNNTFLKPTVLNAVIIDAGANAEFSAGMPDNIYNYLAEKGYVNPKFPNDKSLTALTADGYFTPEEQCTYITEVVDHELVHSSAANVAAAGAEIEEFKNAICARAKNNN